MKKFISVILAIMMVVSVMPFVLFAAEEKGYKEPANQAHVCHPTKDGKLDLTDLDMKALYGAGAYTITFKDGKADENKPEYLVDGKNNTATRLTAGSTEITVETTGKTLIDFATLKIVVNGKGTVNDGSTYADKVTVDTKHNLKLNVVVYGLDKDGKDVVVFTSDKDIDTTNLTEVVLDVYEPAYKVVITTVGAAEAGKGARRIWEIDATTVKGADEYVHTWAKNITKFPSLTEKGEYTQYCVKCGAEDKTGTDLNKYEIPMLTKETLTGGVVTADDIKEYKEIYTQYTKDKDGNKVVAKDDDGNVIQVDKVTGADPKTLFDGQLGTGGGWTGSGNFFAANTNGALEITFKKDITISSFEYYAWANWASVNFEFYKGEDLVAAVNGGPEEHWGCWVINKSTDTWYDVTNYTVTVPKETNPVDFITKLDKDDKPITDTLNGVTFDKLVITFVSSKGNCTKLGEIKIGTHVCVYDDSLAEFGTRVENDPCKYVFSKENASKVVCRECGAAALTAEDGTITMDLHNYKETVDEDGNVVYDYEYHKNAKKVDPTCGKDGSITLTCLNSCENKADPVYKRYTKKVDGKDVPVYGANNQQLYLGKDGKGYDGTEIKDWSTIEIEKYNTKACPDTIVKVLEATGEHKNAVSTVRIGKYPNCGATGTAYVICTDCKQRVDIKTVDDLLGMKLAADIVDINGVAVLKKGATITYKEDKDDPAKTVDDIATIENMFLAMAGGIVTIDIAYTEENTGKAFTVRYTLQNNDKDVLAVTSAVALPSGYHKMGYKTAVASTYTSHGVEGAYCTTCGTEFHDVTREAELLVPNAKLRTLGFSLRTAEFEGLRGTFTLNNEVIKGMQANGYNVRIWVVVTNEAGVSKEVQVYGAGSNAWVALDGKFSVVVKGGTADEVYTFSYKIVVDDSEGTAENVVELGKSSVAEVKAAQ